MELGEGGDCFRHDTVTKVDVNSRGERRGCCQLLEGVGVPGAIGELVKVDVDLARVFARLLHSRHVFARLVHGFLLSADDADDLVVLEHVHKLGAVTHARMGARACVRPFESGPTLQLAVHSVVCSVVENVERLNGIALHFLGITFFKLHFFFDKPYRKKIKKQRKIN